MKISDYAALFKRLLFAFSFYTSYRILFFFINRNYFQSSEASELLEAFLYGFRFDLATVAIVNALFIIFSVIPYRSYSYKIFLKLLFNFLNGIFLIALVVDLEFFSFLGKKMTFDIFGMGGDIKDQLPQLARNYWYFTLLIIGNLLLLWKFFPRVQKSFYISKKMPLYKTLPIGFLIILFTAISIRGGVQLRSLSPKNAFRFDKHELGNLSLNAAYTMIRSIGKKGVPKKSFFKTDEDAVRVIKNSRSFKINFSGVEKQNIIILILESMSQEYIDEGYAPFITSLSKEGISFKKSFANGRRSIEVLPSIMAGFPSIIGKPLYQSQYQSNKYLSLSESLKRNGYDTRFFHGGKTGTMDFDSYCKSIGFSYYYGKEDYPNSKDYDGYWGIYDDKFLEFFLAKSKEFSKPFLGTVFTLSSHQPYSLPSYAKNKYPKGELEIHESIGYVDNSLKEFFKKASKESWYESTLFIITADHTQKLKSKKYNSELGRYRVPIIFYHPKVDLKLLLPEKNKKRIVQHVDIYPSVMDFLNLPLEKHLLYGSSIFSNDQGVMFNAINENYLYLKGEDFLRFNGERTIFYKLGDDLMLNPSSTKPQLLKELKAYIQYTNNGLRSNQIYR